MHIQEVLRVCQALDVGALAVSEHGVITAINKAGRDLLDVDLSICETALKKSAPFLLPLYEGEAGIIEDAKPINPRFGVYVRPFAKIADELLSEDGCVLTFINAVMAFENHILKNILDHVGSCITAWDTENRLLMLNDYAMAFEGHADRSDIGRSIYDMYEMQYNTDFACPTVIKTKKPLLNLRQDYATYSGQELQIVSNSYPVFAGDDIIAAYTIIEDLRGMDKLKREVLRLQQDLLAATGKAKPRHQNAVTASYYFSEIQYAGDDMALTVERLKMAAHSDFPVMLTGEIGTGKAALAQCVHNESDWRGGPFITLNCKDIATPILETMLFGSEKAAFDGAEGQEGLLEQADGGTLYIEQLTEMNPAIQAKLARVLQEKTFYHVGGNVPIYTNVRIISSLNTPADQAVADGSLRKDLYYRLGVIVAHVPALRHRKEDLDILSRYYIRRANKALLKTVTGISAETFAIFEAYDWPGNLYELEHAIEYAMSMMPQAAAVITPEFLPDNIRGIRAETGEERLPESFEEALQQAGHRYLTRALAQHGGNISQTAKAMGTTRQTLQHRLKKYEVLPEKA